MGDVSGDTRPATDAPGRDRVLWRGSILAPLAFGWLFGLAVQGQVALQRDDLLPEYSPDATEKWQSGDWDPRDPLVAKVMWRVGKIDLSVIVENISGPLPAGDVPEVDGGRIFAVQGNLNSLETVSSESGAADAASASDYYVSKLSMGQDRQVVIVSVDIPETFRKQIPTAAECSAAGFFLGQIEFHGQRLPLLAARRLAWNPSPAESLNLGMGLLGRAGVDAGLLEDGVARNGQRLDHNDSLAIVQMLSAVEKGAPDATASPQPLDMIELLRQPLATPGQWYAVVATVSRVTKVELADQPIARRMGIPHYFQIDAFVPIGDRQVNVIDGRTRKPLSYDVDYPVTLIVPDLPPGLNPGSRQHLDIALNAFYYRMWSFASVKSRQIDPQSRQFVPIFVGPVPQAIVVSYRSFASLITILVFGSAFFLLLFAWVFSRTPKWLKSKSNGQSRPASDKIDWAGVAELDSPSGRTDPKS